MSVDELLPYLKAYEAARGYRGAGTGTSDSILAYVADKDRFVYLSDGE